MIRSELVEEVYNRLPQYYRSRYNKKAILRILVTAFEIIMETTSLGEEVSIINFAKISSYKKASHKVWCGLTQEWTEARQHMKLRLRASKRWKNMLQRAWKED